MCVVSVCLGIWCIGRANILAFICLCQWQCAEPNERGTRDFFVLVTKRTPKNCTSHGFNGYHSHFVCYRIRISNPYTSFYLIHIVCIWAVNTHARHKYFGLAKEVSLFDTSKNDLFVSARTRALTRTKFHLRYSHAHKNMWWATHARARADFSAKQRIFSFSICSRGDGGGGGKCCRCRRCFFPFMRINQPVLKTVTCAFNNKQLTNG